MRNVFFIVLGVFLASGCAFLPKQSDVSPAKLKDLVERHLVYLGDGDFDKLPAEVTGKEILFLGEQHRVPALHKATAQLACYLAREKPVVYAYESVYGVHPFLEAGSMGYPDPLWPIEAPAMIKEFNASQPPERKILITAVDIEHTIYHDKPKVVLFLRHLEGQSNSEPARQVLEKKIADLPAQDTYDQMETYLKQLKAVFMEYLKTFSRKDRDEILFYMKLLDVSNRYQYTSRKGNIESWNRAVKIRYPYFKKTIERALNKARERDAILLCRVGAEHVTGNFEARYFAENNFRTKGKVARICFVQIPTDPDQTDPDLSDIGAVVKTMMKDNTYCYLSLNDLKKDASGSLVWSRFFDSRNKPVCDGLLFIKIIKTEPAESTKEKKT